MSSRRHAGQTYSLHINVVCASSFVFSTFRDYSSSGSGSSRHNGNGRPRHAQSRGAGRQELNVYRPMLEAIYRNRFVICSRSRPAEIRCRRSLLNVNKNMAATAAWFCLNKSEVHVLFDSIDSWK